MQLGFIRLTGSGETYWITQGWNPPLMSEAIRCRVADDLREIADRMAANEFEHRGRFRHYSPPADVVTVDGGTPCMASSVAELDEAIAEQTPVAARESGGAT